MQPTLDRNLIDITTREADPDGPSLDSIRTRAQAEADKYGAELAVGWGINDDNGLKEYSYCPASIAPHNAFVIEVLEVVKPRPKVGANHHTGGRVALPSVVGVVDLLDRARAAGLQYPKLWLQLPNGNDLRITMAGERSRTPGFLMLTDGGSYPDNKYFGRISRAGELEIGRDGNRVRQELVALLERLAFNPAQVAAEFGHLTGNCCFCSLKLSDDRSIAVGYGKKCAQRFSLPWGAIDP